METNDQDKKKERIRSLKEKLDAPRRVGDGELVPFAWRQPLADPGKRMSKYYRVLTAAEKERASLPALSDNE